MTAQCVIRRVQSNNAGSLAVYIPKGFARDLGLEKGTYVVIEKRGQEIAIKRLELQIHSD